MLFNEGRYLLRRWIEEWKHNKWQKMPETVQPVATVNERYMYRHIKDAIDQTEHIRFYGSDVSGKVYCYNGDKKTKRVFAWELAY